MSVWGALGSAAARAGCVAVVLLGAGVLAAGCGGGSPAGVATLGSTTTTSSPVAASNPNSAAVEKAVLAYVGCMHTHGEPDMPEPQVTEEGGGRVHINLAATPGASFDPRSRQFSGANAACQHLLPTKGSASSAPIITAADQADYLKAVDCMRTHGFPDFPDPTFADGTVSFNTTARIDTHSSQFELAVGTCEKLIPRGLPYSNYAGS